MPVLTGPSATLVEGEDFLMVTSPETQSALTMSPASGLLSFSLACSHAEPLGHSPVILTLPQLIPSAISSEAWGIPSLRGALVTAGVTPPQNLSK